MLLGNQKKQLIVNMQINKLYEKVNAHQKNVGKKPHTMAKIASALHVEWVDKSDRWVTRFLGSLRRNAIRWRLASNFGSRNVRILADEHHLPRITGNLTVYILEKFLDLFMKWRPKKKRLQGKD